MLPSWSVVSVIVAVPLSPHVSAHVGWCFVRVLECSCVGVCVREIPPLLTLHKLVINNLPPRYPLDSFLSPVVISYSPLLIGCFSLRVLYKASFRRAVRMTEYTFPPLGRMLSDLSGSSPSSWGDCSSGSQRF